MNKIPTKRADGVKWTSEEIGTQDFAEDHKIRTPGSFEKGQKPAGDSADETTNLLEG
jgi:hypothetical protein